MPHTGSGECQLNSGEPTPEREHSAGSTVELTHLAPDNRVTRDRLHPVSRHMHESAVMFDAAFAEQTRQQSEVCCRQHGVDKRLLAFERFERAATRTIVRVQILVRNLREQFGHRTKASSLTSIPAIQRLPENKLPGIR